MSGGVPAGCPCCGALPVDWVDDPYAAADSTKIERAIERMRADPFPDDAHLLGTTQQDARMEHYARVALATPTPPIEGRDADVERVAKAWWDREQQIIWEGGLEPIDWDKTAVSVRAAYNDCARAALQALGERG